MKILITGDFCPINRAAEEGMDENIFDASLLAKIKEADYSITNLECPLTNAKIPIQKTGPALKAHPSTVDILKNTGFDVVTLANNHILDYGKQGIVDTLDSLKKKEIKYVGAGKINDDFSTVYLEKHGLKVAIINICENEWSTNNYGNYSANGLDPMKNFNSIQNAKLNSDKLIVIHHGGHEHYELPSPRMKELFRFFVDAGADAVISHHTHCISGFEVYKNAPIFYSLGNFVFDSPKYRDSIWNYGMVLTLKIEKEKIDFDYFIAEQFNHEQKVTLLNKSLSVYKKIEELSEIINDKHLLSESFKEFIKTKKKLYNSYLEPYKNKYRLALKNQGFLPSGWNPRKRLYLKNLISCESHREIVLNILENENSNI